MLSNKKVIEHHKNIADSLLENWVKRDKSETFTHIWFIKDDSSIEKIPKAVIDLAFQSYENKEAFANFTKKVLKDSCAQGIVLCLEAWMAVDINYEFLPGYYQKAKTEEEKREAYQRCVSESGGVRKFGQLYGRAAEVIFLYAEDDEKGSQLIFYEIKKVDGEDTLVLSKELSSGEVSPFTGIFCNFFS